MVSIIDPNTHTNKLTVSRSRHLLATFIWDHYRRRKLLYDIIHPDRLNYDLDYLEMTTSQIDVDDNQNL